MIRAAHITLLEDFESITDPVSVKRTSNKISRYLIQHSCYFLSLSEFALSSFKVLGLRSLSLRYRTDGYYSFGKFCSIQHHGGISPMGSAVSNIRVSFKIKGNKTLV